MIFNSKFMSSMPEDNEESLFVFETLFVTITRMQSSSWPVVLHNNTMGTKNVLSHLPFSSNIARYGVFGIYNHSQLMKRARKYCVIKFDVKRNQNPAEFLPGSLTIYIMFLLAQIVYLYLIPYLDKLVLLKLGSISSSN